MATNDSITNERAVNEIEVIIFCSYIEKKLSGRRFRVGIVTLWSLETQGCPVLCVFPPLSLTCGFILIPAMWSKMAATIPCQYSRRDEGERVCSPKGGFQKPSGSRCYL